MNRRSILKSVSTAGIAGIAGCQDNRSGRGEPKSTSTETAGQTTATNAESGEAPENPENSTYYIGPDGADSNSGSMEKPLATIQAGLDEAQPGETVFVQSGEYQESDGAWQSTVTVRDGKPDAPITITGPEDAVLYPAEDSSALRIKHSHIHLRGLTIDGLLDPDNPDDPESYARGRLILTIPPDREENIEDIVLAPAAIGNARRALILCERTSHMEIGPLRIMGLAGADYVLGDRETHAGEIIYLGNPLLVRAREEDFDGYPWETIDYTSHVHIHHIDNSEGHPHSELVNAKTGTHDILVEYCTSHGGAQNNDHTPNAEIRFENSDSTLRWCDLRNGQHSGVYLWGRIDDPLPEKRDPKRLTEQVGTGQSVYGNLLQDFEDRAIEGPDSETNTICGNKVSGPLGIATGDDCSKDLPEGDGVGHLGGNSPWG